MLFFQQKKTETMLTGPEIMSHHSRSWEIILEIVFLDLTMDYGLWVTSD